MDVLEDHALIVYASPVFGSFKIFLNEYYPHNQSQNNIQNIVLVSKLLDFHLLIDCIKVFQIPFLQPLIQAKRPFLHTGTGTKSIYNCPYFSFKINKHQQEFLSKFFSI